MKSSGSKMAICTNCGNERELVARGLCGGCGGEAGATKNPYVAADHPASAVEFLEDGRCFGYDEDTGKILEIVLSQGIDVVPPVPTDFKKLVRFPSAVAEDLDLSELVAQLAFEVEQTGCLTTSSAHLVAQYIAATWTVDSLPIGPTLCIWGDPGSYSKIRELLALSCRRSLSLGRFDDATLLPSDLHPTILFNAIKRLPAGLLDVLTGARGPVWEDGRTVEFKSAAVLFSSAPLPGMVSLACDASAVPYRYYSASECERICETYIPQLVHHRLRQHRPAINSLFDTPSISFEARLLARSVGPALEGYPRLQQQLADDLETINSDLRAEKSESIEAIVIEAILHIAHRGKDEVSIATITETVNTMSKWRRCGRITAKKVGSVIRGELGTRPVRRAAGFFVVLDGVAQTELHRAARSLGLLAEDENACQWCNQNLPGNGAVPLDETT